MRLKASTIRFVPDTTITPQADCRRLRSPPAAPPDRPFDSPKYYGQRIGLLAATPSVFKTFGVAMVEGRPFDRRDGRDGTAVVVLSQSAAEQFGRSYAPGKWTATQLFLQLAQPELAFSLRVRMCVTTEYYVVQPFDQDTWGCDVSLS